VIAYLVVLLAGLAAGVLSGIIGTGSSIILLPILVFQFGPKHAVPIMAIAALMANVGKVLAWWREIDWKACAAYSITGAPAAALGARTLLVLPSRLIDAGLALFFLGMIPARRRLASLRLRLSLWQLGMAGAIIGFLTGMVISTGPLSVPAFTAYGLIKGGFLSTAAASSLVLMVSKVTAFQQLGALPCSSILKGIAIGSWVMAGTFIGKVAVQRMSVTVFQHALDGLLLCSGLALLWEAIR
jgi:uncharacterized membrane protein YfcA